MKRNRKQKVSQNALGKNKNKISFYTLLLVTILKIQDTTIQTIINTQSGHVHNKQ